MTLLALGADPRPSERSVRLALPTMLCNLARNLLEPATVGGVDVNWEERKAGQCHHQLLLAIVLRLMWTLQPTLMAGTVSQRQSQTKTRTATKRVRERVGVAQKVNQSAEPWFRLHQLL